jgi:hypothetical protein
MHTHILLCSSFDAKVVKHFRFPLFVLGAVNKFRQYLSFLRHLSRNIKDTRKREKTFLDSTRRSFKTSIFFNSADEDENIFIILNRLDTPTFFWQLKAA